ncbi:MAG: hypothetical protein WBA84_00720 [Carnobacterium sp.]|uniref:hypothetical protein n=1 Tax=Carnobacterium sp. TaxID=48221 RepID=UPI003C73D2A1
MEEVFSLHLNKITDKESFIVEWMNFLAKTPGDKAGELLTEVSLYQGGINRLCEVAYNSASLHPVLYENASTYFYGKELYLECKKIGLEAINRLAVKLVIRAKITERTIKAANKLNHNDRLSELYKAAFYSKSTLVHYLRLFRCSGDALLTRKASKYAQNLPDAYSIKRSTSASELNENGIRIEEKMIIRFFNHEFDAIQDLCKKRNNYLDWNSDLKGRIIPLFLLMLDNTKKVSKAKQRIIQSLTTDLRISSVDKERFIEDCFRWKKTVQFTAEQAEIYLLWLDYELAKRADAIVGGGHRKIYHKVAELIVFLGEVWESNGDIHKKKTVVEKYKESYSRKRAFKNELDQLN